MSKIRKLYFKDISALRFIAFLPVFLYLTLYLLKSKKESVLNLVIELLEQLSVNSLDFFFFLSSFLITSLALREYKYKQSFSLKKFYIRRLLRIIPLLLPLLIFAFYFHTYILNVLQLTPLNPNSIKYYLIGLPNYFASITYDRYTYTIVLFTIYMFLQFYLLWGFVLKYLKNRLIPFSIILIISGIAVRLTLILSGVSFYFDIFSYLTPIGLGAILAYLIRNNEAFIQRFKKITKKQITLVYTIGILIVFLGYVLFKDSIFQAILPFFTCLFYAFIILEQTFSKASIFKLRKNKLMTRMGKISYGLLVFTPIIATILNIAFESIDKDLESILFKVLYVISSFVLTWLIADLMYNFYEKLFRYIKRDFNRI